MSEITNKTTLEKILKIKGAEEILAKHSVPCLSCPMASFEIGKEPYGESAHWRQIKIGQVAKTYGLNLTSILNDLNGLFKKAIK